MNEGSPGQSVPYLEEQRPDDGFGGHESSGPVPLNPLPDLSILETSVLPAPEFPLTVMGQWEGWVSDAARSKGAPVDYVAMVLIVVMASVIGNARTVSPWRGWVEPVILWLALIGNPSSGKSPALDAVIASLQALEKEIGTNYPETLRQFTTLKEAASARDALWQNELKASVKEGREPSVRPEGAVEPDRPARPRLMVSDSTQEALVAVLMGQKKGVLQIYDELVRFMDFERYNKGGSGRAFALEMFGGRRTTVDRVKDDGQPKIVERTAVSVIGGIQPDPWAQFISGSDDGFSSRILPVHPDPVLPVIPDCEPDHARLLNALRRLHFLEMAIDGNGDEIPRCIPLATDVAEHFQAWRLANNLEEKDATGQYLSHLGKLPGMLLRISLVIEFMGWADQPGAPEPAEVSMKSFGLAAHLIESYCKPMARRTIGNAALAPDERHLTAVARWIRANRSPITTGQKGLLNARETRRQGIGGKKSPDEMDATFAALVEANWISPARNREGDSPGRKRKDFTVNPLVWEGME